MIHLEEVNHVIQETKRFLEIATKAKKKLKRESEDPNSYVSIVGCKETAAMKRASLDLSNVLVELRRPPGKSR